VAPHELVKHYIANYEDAGGTGDVEQFVKAMK
jgi:hypothetical protein